MNYQKIYDSLVANAICSPYLGYTENHHIIPKCLGGNDDPENIVAFSARQHFIAHWLLYKIHRTSKLAHAWNNMCRIDKHQTERIVNSKYFEYARNAHRKAMRECVGEKNHFYGKTHSDETKKYLSDVFTGYDRRSSNGVKSWIEKVAKREKSAEHKAKIGRKNLVMLKNIHSGECVRVDKHIAETEYDTSEWQNPYTIREKQYGECPYCKKYGELNSTFKRWHFNNCKENK